MAVFNYKNMTNHYGDKSNQRSEISNNVSRQFDVQIVHGGDNGVPRVKSHNAAVHQAQMDQNVVVAYDFLLHFDF